MFEKSSYIVVNYPIRVPRGDYCFCWNAGGDSTICSFFSNEGGHGTCDLNFSDIICTPEGFYKKAKHCRDLEER